MSLLWAWKSALVKANALADVVTQTFTRYGETVLTSRVMIGTLHIKGTAQKYNRLSVRARGSLWQISKWAFSPAVGKQPLLNGQLKC